MAKHNTYNRKREHSLLILKPCAVGYLETVAYQLAVEGLGTSWQSKRRLPDAVIKKLYASKRGAANYDRLCMLMKGGAAYFSIVSGRDAVARLRGEFPKANELFHMSDSLEAATREIKIFNDAGLFRGDYIEQIEPESYLVDHLAKP